MPDARCRMWWIPPHRANNLLWRRQTPEFTPAGISLRTKKAKASVTGWARERAAEVPMAAVAVKRVLFVCGALGLIPPLLDCEYERFRMQQHPKEAEDLLVSLFFLILKKVDRRQTFRYLKQVHFTRCELPFTHV